MKFLFGYDLLVLSILLKVCGGLRCMSCKETPDLSQCLLLTAECQAATEECYLDVKTNSLLQTVYSAGCRSTDICNLIASGKRDTSVSCAQCCKTNRDDFLPCNGFLCGKSVSEKGTCIVCEKSRDPSLCQQYTRCQANEVCSQYQYISRGLIYYDLGCTRKEICRAFLAHGDQSSRNKEVFVGRRELGTVDICFACCDGVDCNRKRCLDIRSNMTMAMFA